MTQELNVGKLHLVHTFSDNEDKFEYLSNLLDSEVEDIDDTGYYIFGNKLYQIENLYYQQPDEAYIVNTYDDESVEYVLFHDSSVKFSDALNKALTGASYNEDLWVWR